ncbi:MAG: DMT family transporter [Elusimicrobiota bacterium]
MKPPSRTALAHISLLIVVAIWGATFTLVKSALRDISPLFFNFLRMALAFIFLAAFRKEPWRALDRKTLAAGAWVGIFLGLGYQFQTLGLSMTTPSKSAFITGLLVVFVPIFSLVPGLRPAQTSAPGPAVWLGAATAFIGLLLLTLPPGSAGLGASFAAVNPGDWLTLACAVCFALQILVLSKVSGRAKFGDLALLQIGFSAILMACTGPCFERVRISLNAMVLATLGVTAILGTAAAFTAQSFAQEVLPSTTVVLIMALEPVFASATSFVFLHDRLSGRAVAGAGLVLAGILATEMLPRFLNVRRHENGRA